MKEVHIENSLARYPEIIEPGLTLYARQYNTHGKAIDLIFRDCDDRLLIVEVKVGTLTRTDVGQICEYRHYVREDSKTLPRGMLVGTKIPREIAGALNVAGCEFLLITHQELETFLLERGDMELLAPMGVVARVQREAQVRPKRAKRVDGRRYVDILLKVLEGVPIGTVFQASELYEAAERELNDPAVNIRKGLLLSDKCYNMANIGLGINHPHQLFECVGWALYKYLGKNYPYTGKVTWKDVGCGEWKEGVATKWDNWPSTSTQTASRDKALLSRAVA